MAGGPEHGTKAILAALSANFCIAIAKLVGALITGSGAMLAESFHSFADSGNQALLLFGHRRARKPPTPEHPFGYGRERYFWSFVVALVLFMLGAVFAIWEGINKIRHPEHLSNLTLAIAILGGAIVLEAFSFRIAVKESNAVRGNASWVSFIRRSKSPELPVILLEDLGAMLGLVIAFVSVIISEVTGNALWDGIGTLSIGILLGLIAIVLAVEMQSLLIGEAAAKPVRERIVALISSSPQVSELISIRTQHMGPDDLLVAAKVRFEQSLTATQIAEEIDSIQDSIKAEVPVAQSIYLEPDLAKQTG